MPKGKEGQRTFWDPKGHDWSPATQIVWQSRDPEGETEKGDALGFYNKDLSYIWVDSDDIPFTEGTHERVAPGKTVDSSRGGTLSHEIGHWKLKHRGMLLPKPQHDTSDKEEFWSILDFVEPRVGMQVRETWESLRNEVHEFEVRLYQELQEYHQDRGDSFFDYFVDLLLNQIEQNPRKAYLVKEAAYQALRNIEKRGLLTKKKKLRYWKMIDTYYDQTSGIPSWHTLRAYEEPTETKTWKGKEHKYPKPPPEDRPF